MSKSTKYKEPVMDNRGVPSPRRRVRSQADFRLTSRDRERPIGRSLTIPDDSYSIQDLLQRHLDGMAPDVLKSPLYDLQADEDSDQGHDLEDMSKFPDLDFADQDSVLRSARMVQDAYRVHLEQVKLKAEQAKAEAERANNEAQAAKQKASSAGVPGSTTPS